MNTTKQIPRDKQKDRNSCRRAVYLGTVPALMSLPLGQNTVECSGSSDCDFHQ